MQTEIKLIQLPNAIREYLLQKHETCVRVWELLLALGTDEVFSVDEAWVALRDVVEISRYAIYQGLRDLVRLKVVAIKQQKNKGRGRPVHLFRLTPVNIIIERWNLIRGVADSITIDALRSVKTYRAALHRAFLKRVGNWTRKSLGRRLGVSSRATYNYEQLYNDIEVVPQFWEMEVILPRDNQYDPMTIVSSFVPEKLPIKDGEEYKGGRRWLETYVEKPYTEAEILERNLWAGATKRVLKKFPYLRVIANKLLEQGKQVFAKEQLANKYIVGPYANFEFETRDYTGGKYADWVES